MDNLELPIRVEIKPTKEELIKDLREVINEINRLSSRNKELREKLQNEPDNYEVNSGMLLSNTNELNANRLHYIYTVEAFKKLKEPEPIGLQRTPTGFGGVYTQLAEMGISSDHIGNN